MRPIALLLAATACGLLLIAHADPAPTQDDYTGIPEGFDFPADEQDLETYRTTENVSEMRRHGWFLWAGVNQPAASGGPIWETWFPSPETFRVGTPPQGAMRERRVFAPPRQHQGDGAVPQAEGQSLLSFVLFNQEAHAHIRNNDLHMQSKLTELNDAFDSSTPLPDRKILDFERESVVLKVVWVLVQKEGLTPMPIFDFEDLGPTNPPSSWSRHVAVDPSRTTIPVDETATVNVGGVPREAHVVPLADFYNFAIKTEIERASAEAALGETVEIGDHAALVCMHLTTKEISDWVWTTYWWHDRPDSGPFAADRVAEVTGVWRNYLMDVAYDMDTPREYDGTPNACINPWLEARFPGGMGSNCMTCHQRSVWPVISFLPVTRGALDPDDDFFKDHMKLDFLWSIAFEGN